MESVIENPTDNKAGVNLEMWAEVDMHSEHKAILVALLCYRNCGSQAFTVQGYVSCFFIF
jgi:hypothetical protein